MSDENKDDLNTDQTDKDKDKDKDKKPRFTADQIAQINRIRDEALEAERKRLQSEWQQKLDAQKAELEQKFQQAIEQAKPKGDDKKDDKGDKPPKPDPEVEQLRASFEELKNMFNTVRSEKETLQQQMERQAEERRLARRKDQFLSALSSAKVDFYDPLEAYELAVKEGLDYDMSKDRAIVKSPTTGAPKLNEHGDEMSVIDFIKDFAARKKYLVKAPTQDGGTGSGEQRRVEETKEKKFDFSKMTNDEFEKFRQEVMSKR